MGIFKWLFSKVKQIEKTEIVEETEGLDEDEQFTNIIIGDELGGFEGAVAADVYNQYHSAKTTFLVTYTDGTTELVETENGSSWYRKYMRYLSEDE